VAYTENKYIWKVLLALEREITGVAAELMSVCTKLKRKVGAYRKPCRWGSHLLWLWMNCQPIKNDFDHHVPADCFVHF